MKGIQCKICGYIALNGVAPDNCPVCGAPKTAFIEKDDLIKPAIDPNNLTDSEKKHVPVIVMVKKCGLIPDGCQDVHVKIGETQHPMLPEHFIIHMDFYIDKEFISRVILKPGKVNPAAGLHLSAKEGKLSVVSLCNLHGNWISESDI